MIQITRHKSYYKTNRKSVNGYYSRLPSYHHIRTELDQYEDADENKDHVIQEEFLEAYDLKLLRENTMVRENVVQKSDKSEEMKNCK